MSRLDGGFGFVLFGYAVGNCRRRAGLVFYDIMAKRGEAMDAFLLFVLPVVALVLIVTSIVLRVLSKQKEGKPHFRLILFARISLVVGLLALIASVLTWCVFAFLFSKFLFWLEETFSGLYLLAG